MQNPLTLSPLARNSVIASVLLASNLPAQSAGFSAQNLISTSADRARDVDAADLDGDGDLDAISASTTDSKVAWYENLGGGVFGSEQVISLIADSPYSLDHADFDGDGDTDIASAGDKISWYPNLGGGAFGNEIVVEPTSNLSFFEIVAVDLDSDGDSDLLSVNISTGLVVWHENLGAGSFGPKQSISPVLNAPVAVQANDLDGDGDLDVLTASKGGSPELVWFANLGGGSFGPKQIISTEGGSVDSLFSIDLDGDGDPDVLSASRNDSSVAWFENLSGGAFGPRQIISESAPAATSIYADDLDGDGDADVVYGGIVAWDKVGWFENQGEGLFGPLLAIVAENSPAVIGLWEIHVADLNGDGRPDVMSASTQDDKISWWANEVDELALYSCNGDGGVSLGCTDCPCGNNAPQGTKGGCSNSAGTSCNLLPTGTFAVGGDNLVFRAVGAPPFSNALLVSGNQLLPANPASPCFGSNSGIQSLFFDGIRCVGQGLVRHGVRQADANGAIGVTNNGWGGDSDPSVCSNNCPTLNFTESLLGLTKHFQLFYRDDALEVCQTGQNTSQAVSVTFRF